jgi:hypothetical protein
MAMNTRGHRYQISKTKTSLFIRRSVEMKKRQILGVLAVSLFFLLLVSGNTLMAANDGTKVTSAVSKQEVKTTKTQAKGSCCPTTCDTNTKCAPCPTGSDCCGKAGAGNSCCGKADAGSACCPADKADSKCCPQSSPSCCPSGTATDKMDDPSI